MRYGRDELPCGCGSLAPWALVGVVAGNGLASVVWLLKLNLESRLRDLVAVPDGGLELAMSLTDSVADGFTEMATQVDAVRAAADRLAAQPEPGPAAASELAAAVAIFVQGPYAVLRDVYGRRAGTRHRPGRCHHGLRTVRAHGAHGRRVIERLTAIDGRLQEVDASVTHLAGWMRPHWPSPAWRPRSSEQATRAQETLANIDTLIAGPWSVAAATSSSGWRSRIDASRAR